MKRLILVVFLLTSSLWGQSLIVHRRAHPGATPTPTPSIAFDNTGVTGVATGQGGDTYTLSGVTIGSGSNRFLYCGISYLSSNSLTVASVTFNGSAMTRAGGDVNGIRYVDGWYMVAPTTGTFNVVFTFSGTYIDHLVAGCVSLTGVHQTTPIGTAVSAHPVSPTISVTATSATGEVVLDTVVSDYEALNLHVTASQTQRWNTCDGSSTGYICGGGSSKAGETSTVMSWATDNNNDFAMVAVPVKPN